MRKLFFTLILALILISIVPAFAARVYDYDFGDQSIWSPVEESYIEGQQEKEQGPIRISRGIGIGWFKPSNAVEVLDKIDFGNGLLSIKAMVAAQFPEGYFKENMPDAIFEIRVDSMDGPVVATVKPEGSDGWDIEVETECTVTDVGKQTKGEHTIYIVNKIGTPEQYLDGTLKASCNFNKLTLETDSVEPTPSPTPEATDETTSSPTPKITNVPITNPPITHAPKTSDNSISTDIFLYAGIAAVIIVVIIVVSIILLRKKK